MDKALNDTQDQAIWDRASLEHNNLCKLYEEREELKRKQLEELERLKMRIDNKEREVLALCEGRIKTFYDKKTQHLIMDLTD